MISRVRTMLNLEMTPDEVRKELRAQGVDNELAFWATKAALFEIEHWKKEAAKNGNV